MKESNISWVLVGIRSRDGETLSEEKTKELLEKSFQEGTIYKLFLCGTEMEKGGSLEEMEEGYEKIKNGVSEFQDGDYCIIASHAEADLLFLPTVLENE